MDAKLKLWECTAQIVAAYVAKNALEQAEIPQLIAETSRALSQVGTADGGAAEPRPAVAVRKSITPDYLVCLEDGKKFKSLKRHLRAHYNLSPDEYRAKWNLPPDYPMVAPRYAEERSNLAKRMRLGQRLR